MSAAIRRACIDPLESRRLLSSVAFAIDSSASTLTIDAHGKVKHVGSVGLGAQDEGLDTAHYRGTLVADVGSKGIRFNGGSRIEAIEHSGSFSPSNGPAAYAVDGHVKKLFVKLATVKADVTGLVLDLTSSSRKQRNGDRQFAIRNAQVTATSGTIDYKVDSRFGDADGSKSFAGMKADVENAAGKMTGKPGQRVLTVPITVHFSRDLANGASAEFTLSGQIVGRETSSTLTQAVSAAVAAKTPVARPRTSLGFFSDSESSTIV